MNREDFQAGITSIETCLQGLFDPGFVLWLSTALSHVDGEDWREMVDLMCRQPKNARQVVYNDFLQAYTSARLARHERMKAESQRVAAQERRDSEAAGIAGTPRTLVEILTPMVAKVSDPSTAEWIERLVQELREAEIRRDRPLSADEQVWLARSRNWPRYVAACERMGLEPDPPQGFLVRNPGADAIGMGEKPSWHQLEGA